MAEVLDCSLEVSKFNSNHTIMCTFELIPLGKVWTLLFPHPVMDLIVSLFFYKNGFVIK